MCILCVWVFVCMYVCTPDEDIRPHGTTVVIRQVGVWNWAQTSGRIPSALTMEPSLQPHKSVILQPKIAIISVTGHWILD